jgi:hypothetical protein
VRVLRCTRFMDSRWSRLTVDPRWHEGRTSPELCATGATMGQTSPQRLKKGENIEGICHSPVQRSRAEASICVPRKSLNTYGDSLWQNKCNVRSFRQSENLLHNDPRDSKRLQSSKQWFPKCSAASTGLTIGEVA